MSQHNPGRTRSGALGTEEQTAGLITTNLEIDGRIFTSKDDGRPNDVNNTKLVKQGYRFLDTQFSLGLDPFGLCHIVPGDLLMTYKRSPPTDTRSGKDLGEVRQNVFPVWNGYKIPPHIKTQDQFERGFAAAGFSGGFYTYGALKQHESGGAGELRGGRSIYWRSAESGWPGELVMWTAPSIFDEKREQEDSQLPADGGHPVHRRQPILKIFRPERDVPQFMRHVITRHFSPDSKLLSNVAAERKSVLNAQQALNPDIVPSPELDTEDETWYSHIDASMDALMQQLIVLWQFGAITINAPAAGQPQPTPLRFDSNVKLGEMLSKRFVNGAQQPLQAGDYNEVVWLAALLGRFNSNSSSATRQPCTALIREALGRANYGFMNNVSSTVTQSYDVRQVFPAVSSQYGAAPFGGRAVVPMTPELDQLKTQLSRSQNQAPQRRLAADATAYRAMANRVVCTLASTATPGAITDVVF